MDCRVSAVQQIYQLEIIGELLEIAFLMEHFIRAQQEVRERSWHGRTQTQIGLFYVYTRIKDLISQVAETKSSKEAIPKFGSSSSKIVTIWILTNWARCEDQGSS